MIAASQEYTFYLYNDPTQGRPLSPYGYDSSDNRQICECLIQEFPEFLRRNVVTGKVRVTIRIELDDPKS